MNEELDFIKKEGWILSESGLKTIDLNGSGKKNITKLLLDRDLREIGAGISDLHKGKFENVEHESVILQILKSRNISAPKSNELSKTAPKLMKLQLTDGQNTYSAIEMEPTALSLETRPGTKISLKVKQLKYANGQLLLTPKNMEILGGYVESLVSKWEISRSLATQMKGNRSGAAPPFIPFGQKIQQNLPNDRGFKSLQQNKQKEAEENSEFNAQRQDAIAEASKAGTRKTFGGGNKTLVDSNVQKIMDKGYTEEQATVALKYAKNNVEKALGNLKRRDERQQQRAGSHDYNNTRGENTRDYNSKRGDRKGGNSEPPQAKPSTGVSLFDFLENKIPETTSTSSTAKQSSSYTHNSTNNNNKYDKYESKYDNHERFENNISSSFRKHDKENSNKSQQWSQYSSSNEQKSSQNYQKNSYNSRNNDYRNNNNNNHESSSREHSTRDYNNRKYDRDSRDYRSGDGQRDTRDSRDSKYHQSSNYSSKPNTASSSSGNVYSKSSHAINQKPSSSTSTSNAANNNRGSSDNNSYNNHHSTSSSNKGKYGQKPDYNNGRDNRNSSSKEYNNYSSSTGANNSNYNSNKPPRPNHPNNNNNNNNNSSSMSSHHHHSSSSHSNDMYQKPRERNLVESMEKMNIKQQSYKSYESSYESKSSSYPPLTSSSNESKSNFAKPQSNYSIVGFQNKEANEQAKNALKTKNIPGNVQAPPTWQTTQQQVPIPVPVISQQTLTKGPPPPFSSNSVPQAAPQPMHSIQPTQSFVQHQVMHAMPQAAAVLTTSNPPPTVFHAAPITYPGQIIMQSVQPPQIQQVPQQLKIGDFCLAKYWEDGKFYNAKITGVSESTYVVLFTDYGNAEEVRKNDCLPLISVPTCPTPPQPITNFVPPQMGSYRISSQQKMPQQHNYHSQQGMPYKGAGSKPRRN